MTSVSITLERNPQPHHLPFILAQGVGLFEDRGLEVELHPPSRPFQPEKPAGDADLNLILTSPLHLVDRFLNGATILGIARVYENEAALLLRPELGYEQPGDLSGPVSVASQGLDQDTSRTILSWISRSKDGDLSPEDVTVKTPDTPLEAFLEGEVDLLFPAWLVPDVVRSHSVDADSWYFPNIGLPDAGDLVLAGDPEALNAAPNETQSLLGAIHAASTRIHADPEQAKQILRLHADSQNLQYSDELVESSLDGFTQDLGQASDCYREWGDFLEEHGNHEGFLDLDRIMDERFIPFDAMDLSF